MKTAKEVIAHIKNMDDVERYKVVRDIADFVHGPKAELVNELTLEFLKIKKDVDYLSRKIGLHDMYFNRIKKEIEEIRTPK